MKILLIVKGYNLSYDIKIFSKIKHIEDYISFNTNQLKVFNMEQLNTRQYTKLLSFYIKDLEDNIKDTYTRRKNLSISLDIELKFFR